MVVRDTKALPLRALAYRRERAFQQSTKRDPF
jgi:hypothetical protein